MASADRVPVIVGVGERLDRPADLRDGLDPLALMAEALARADEDAGGGLLARADSLDVVNLVSWRYADPAASLCERIGVAPARAVYGEVGGETPIRMVHEAALRIAAGETRIAAICGAEAQSTAAKAARAGVEPPWPPRPPRPARPQGPAGGSRAPPYLHPLAARLGVADPVGVYPLYDIAASAAWGQTPGEALAESGALWAAYSRVAADNPNAWLPRAHTAEEIVVPSADNRLVAWPYTKLMVANPMVNQGAAVLMTSVAQARAMGVAADRMVHVWGGAFAQAPRDYLQRDGFAASPHQEAVLQAAMAIAEGQPWRAMELYSCFPCVPKMARRTLGFGPDLVPTVTGGLTFFGAPLNNHMTHAVCAMVQRLRRDPGVGLLYGQGEFVTKHHALVVASDPAATPIDTRPASVQADADRRMGPIPGFATDASGRARLETFTVLYGRDGAVVHGVAVVRTGGGERALARVPAQDEATLGQLMRQDASPVGGDGELGLGGDGLLTWRGLA